MIEKTGKMEIRSVKAIHNSISPLIWGAVLFYFVYSFTTDCTNEINFKPIYRDAIKSVDPIEYFKESDTHKDFATF